MFDWGGSERVLKKDEPIDILTPSPQPLSPEFKGEGLKIAWIRSFTPSGEAY
jgi:hypothetical protein